MKILKTYQEEQLLMVLRNKALNIAKDIKYDGHQRGLASMVCNFFYKKSKGTGINLCQTNS